MNDTQQQPDELGRRDAGGIVVGWLTKLAIVTAIVAVLGFDAISVGLGHLNTTSDGDKAVQAASQNFLTTHSEQKAYAAATETLNSHEEIPVASFSIDPDGTTHLSVTNTIHTLVLFRVAKTAKLAVITEKVSGKYTGS